jgi:hypothetical protein
MDEDDDASNMKPAAPEKDDEGSLTPTRSHVADGETDRPSPPMTTSSA